MKHLILIAALAGALNAGCMIKSPGSSCPEGSGLSELHYKGADLADGQFALTYDDGPTIHTPAVLDLLDEFNVKATFFVIGGLIQAGHGTLTRMKESGHLIGNHTYSHPDLRDSPNPVQEVQLTDKLIQPYVAGDAFVFRPPYGLYAGRVATRLNQAGLKRYTGPINWDIGDTGNPDFAADTDCWLRQVTPEECGKRYVAEMEFRKKGIILLHDTSEETVKLTRTILEGAKARGYSFVRVDMVPGIKEAVESAGGRPGAPASDESCDLYR